MEISAIEMRWSGVPGAQSVGWDRSGDHFQVYCNVSGSH